MKLSRIPTARDRSKNDLVTKPQPIENEFNNTRSNANQAQETNIQTITNAAYCSLLRHCYVHAERSYIHLFVIHGILPAGRPLSLSPLALDDNQESKF